MPEGVSVKRILLTAVIALLALSLPAIDAEAKRLGGGNSSGMKRAAPEPSKAAPAQAAPAPAAPAPTPAAPAAPPPRSSWMGPIAGLAAGIGLAALASHFGFGGALANVMTMVLIGVAVMFLIGFLLRRFGKSRPQEGLQGMQFSGAGAPFPGQPPLNAAPQASGSPEMPVQAAAVAAPAAVANDGFDTAGFEQIAKRVFLRLQQANDAADQNDLRRFTTPEMFSGIQQELLERKGFQHTEVLQLDSKVIERVEENGMQIVSVRFSGMLREQAEAERFDEVWHLVRPLDGSRDWAIAGIQQSS